MASNITVTAFRKSEQISRIERFRVRDHLSFQEFQLEACQMMNLNKCEIIEVQKKVEGGGVPVYCIIENMKHIKDGDHVIFMMTKISLSSSPESLYQLRCTLSFSGSATRKTIEFEDEFDESASMDDLERECRRRFCLPIEAFINLYCNETTIMDEETITQYVKNIDKLDVIVKVKGYNEFIINFCDQRDTYRRPMSVFLPKASKLQDLIEAVKDRLCTRGLRKQISTMFLFASSGREVLNETSFASISPKQGCVLLAKVNTDDGDDQGEEWPPAPPHMPALSEPRSTLNTPLPHPKPPPPPPEKIQLLTSIEGFPASIMIDSNSEFVFGSLQQLASVILSENWNVVRFDGDVSAKAHEGMALEIFRCERLHVTNAPLQSIDQLNAEIKSAQSKVIPIYIRPMNFVVVSACLGQSVTQVSQGVQSTGGNVVSRVKKMLFIPTPDEPIKWCDLLKGLSRAFDSTGNQVISSVCNDKGVRYTDAITFQNGDNIFLETLNNSSTTTIFHQMNSHGEIDGNQQNLSPHFIHSGYQELATKTPYASAAELENKENKKELIDTMIKMGCDPQEVYRVAEVSSTVEEAFHRIEQYKSEGIDTPVVGAADSSSLPASLSHHPKAAIAVELWAYSVEFGFTEAAVLAALKRASSVESAIEWILDPVNARMIAMEHAGDQFDSIGVDSLPHLDNAPVLSSSASTSVQYQHPHYPNSSSSSSSLTSLSTHCPYAENSLGYELWDMGFHNERMVTEAMKRCRYCNADLPVYSCTNIDCSLTLTTLIYYDAMIPIVYCYI